MSNESSDFTRFFGPNGFDPFSVPPPQNFDALPPNDYVIIVDSAEIKDTKAGTGSYVAIKASVLDGPFKGRKLWDNINFRNQNSTCQGIGQSSLGAISIAAGCPKGERVTTTDELLNKPMIAKVTVRDDRNNIVDYKPLAGAPTQQAAPAVQPAPQQAQKQWSQTAAPVQYQYGQQVAAQPAQQTAQVQPAQQETAYKEPWKR